MIAGNLSGEYLVPKVLRNKTIGSIKNSAPIHHLNQPAKIATTPINTACVHNPGTESTETETSAYEHGGNSSAKAVKTVVFIRIHRKMRTENDYLHTRSEIL